MIDSPYYKFLVSGNLRLKEASKPLLNVEMFRLEVPCKSWYGYLTDAKFNPWFDMYQYFEILLSKTS